MLDYTKNGLVPLKVKFCVFCVFWVVTPLICEAWKVSVEVQDECHQYQTALSYS